MSFYHARKAVRERIARNRQRVRGVHDREEREAEIIRALARADREEDKAILQELRVGIEKPTKKDKPVIVI
jgi:hypothetical protein